MRPLLAATAAVALGCVSGLRWPAGGDLAAFLAVVIACVAAVAALGWLTGPDRRNRAGTFVLLGCAGWTLGASGAHAVLRDCRFSIEDGARIRAVGVLEGVARPAGSTLLEARWLEIAGRKQTCAGALRVRLPARAEVPPAGLLLLAEGRWWANPSGSRWPAPPERAGMLTVTRLVPADEEARGLLAMRGRVQARIRAQFGPVAGMVEAVLLARTEALDRELRDAFAASGLSHLLAISGTHVGMIAGAVLLLGRMMRLAVRPAAVMSGVLTSLYVLLLGAPHGAARAAVQVLLLVTGRVVQRPSDPFTLMAAAALLLLAVSPLALLDAGFQLSFAGVFGLLAFQAPIQGRLPAGLSKPARDTLAATAAASATTLPIAALHFGQVSFIGLASNLVAVPLMGIAVPAAALALAGDALHPALGSFLAGGARVPFHMLERVAIDAAAVPGGHVYWGPGAVTAALIATAAFVVLIRVARGATNRPVRDRAILVAAAGGLAVGGLQLPAFGPGHLEIHVIDVGQGDAIAVQTPGGRWILVDTGPRTDRFDAGAARVVPYLRDRGVRTIDLLVLTHPDLDHIGGAPAVLRSLSVGALIDPALPAPKPGFHETLEAARETGVPWYAGRAGREVGIDGVTLELLAPDEVPANGEANDVSVVFRLVWGPFSALFTGDAPRAVENALVALRDTAIAIDLLKVGHHGSRTSTGDSLLAAARPEVAVLSVGARNRYGHPDPGVVARLARFGVRILRTDRDGSIVVRVDPSGEITYTSER